MRELEIDKSTFIYGGFIKSEVCDDLISYFEESPMQEKGECGRGIDPGHKLSTDVYVFCLLYTSPSPRDGRISRMPSSA